MPEKVDRGNEVIIEREDHRPVAVMKQPQPVGREISECIALAEAYEEKLGHRPVPDEDFARSPQPAAKRRVYLDTVFAAIPAPPPAG